MDGQTNSAKAKPLLDAYLTIIVQHLVADRLETFKCTQTSRFQLQTITRLAS